MAKITRGFFSDPHVVMGDQPIRGFMIKTSDVSRSVPWVHWTHHEKRAFGTNRNLQVFSIPKMHPSHSNSSKIEKWQYLPFLVVVEPPIQKKIFISTNHPNYGWKRINVWNSQRVLWLLSILSLSVEFLSQVVARVSISWILNDDLGFATTGPHKWNLFLVDSPFLVASRIGKKHTSSAKPGKELDFPQDFHCLAGPTIPTPPPKDFHLEVEVTPSTLRARRSRYFAETQTLAIFGVDNFKWLPWCSMLESISLR